METRRLKRDIERLAAHPDFPGKANMIQNCLDELDRLYLHGEMRREEWVALVRRLEQRDEMALTGC